VIRLDGAALAFALVVTTVTGLGVGLIPALQASRGALRAGLERGGGRRAVGDQRLTRGTLVVAEVALALVLLVSAGLLLRSLERLFAVDVGFDAAPLLTMQVQATGHRLDADSARVRFYEQALESVRGVPGVTAAAFTSLLPQSGDADSYGVHFESDDARGTPTGGDSGDGDGAALRYAVTPDYFAAMRIPLRRGRLLDARDRAGAPRAAVVNESFARRKFPGRDAVGERLRFGADDGQWYTIVGVVGDVKQSSLLTERADAVYTTPEQWTFADNPMSFVIRTRDRAAMLTPEIRRAIWAVDKDQPIMRVAMMERLVADSAAERRFALILFQAFSVVALLLAALGIYGVLATSVIERTREIGVRSALGATRTAILALVLRQGLSLTALGAAIGLAGGLFASRGLATLLFNTSRFDPLTYSGVLALLVSVAVLACWIPAWRAARVDPSVALRSD
jgi:putative ABC transport system permease protein